MYIECQICHKKLKFLNIFHLKIHNISIEEYNKLYPDFKVINPFLNKHHTEETKKKMSKNHADFSNEKHPRWGTHCSEETKKKISENKERAKKISIVLKNRIFTDEWKNKISNALKGKRKGIYNPNWNGGVSRQPYSWKFNEELKESIRYRDNYICQKCNKIQKNNQRLTIHHIDYDKKNCCITNLISLHDSCHSKTNYHRNYWQEYFTDLLHEQFSLKRHFEGDI